MNYGSFLLFLGAFCISATFSVKNEGHFDTLGMTRLHYAILDDKTDLVGKMIVYDDDDLVDLPDEISNSTPLHLLVEKVSTQTGDAQAATVKLIQSLVDLKVDRERKTDSGWTALTKAVYLASDFVDYPLGVIEILLKDCVAVNARTRGQTALHFAAGSRLQNNRSKDLVELLKKHCASSIDYNAALDSNEWTAMKVALAADNMDTVAILKPFTSSLSFNTKMILGIGVVLFVLGIGMLYYLYKNAIEPETSKSTKSADYNGAGVSYKRKGAGKSNAVEPETKSADDNGAGVSDESKEKSN